MLIQDAAERPMPGYHNTRRPKAVLVGVRFSRFETGSGGGAQVI